MGTFQVQLPEHFERFIQEAISRGEYADASAVIAEGLRLLEEHGEEEREKVEELRRLAQEGFDAADRGEYVAVETEEELDALLDKLSLEARAELKRG